MIASLSDTAIRGRLSTIDLTALRLDDQLRQAALPSPRLLCQQPFCGYRAAA